MRDALMSNFEYAYSKRERFADLGIMESCPATRAQASYLASASPSLGPFLLGRNLPGKRGIWIGDFL